MRWNLIANQLSIDHPSFEWHAKKRLTDWIVLVEEGALCLCSQNNW